MRRKTTQDVTHFPNFIFTTTALAQDFCFVWNKWFSFPFFLLRSHFVCVCLHISTKVSFICLSVERKTHAEALKWKDSFTVNITVYLQWSSSNSHTYDFHYNYIVVIIWKFYLFISRVKRANSNTHSRFRFISIRKLQIVK